MQFIKKCREQSGRPLEKMWNAATLSHGSAAGDDRLLEMRNQMKSRYIREAILHCLIALYGIIILVLTFYNPFNSK